VPTKIDSDASAKGRGMPSYAWLTKKARAILDFAAKFQVSLLISLAALSISITQLYLTNFRKTSSLVAFIDSLNLSTANHVDQEEGIKFDLTGTISTVLTNIGNAPTTLMKIFYIVPDESISCESLKSLDWDFYGSEGFSIGRKFGRAFSNRALVVAPGATSISQGEVKIVDATRRRELVGKERTVCLMFITLDHAAKVHIASINGGTITVHKNTSGQRYSESIKSPIDLMK
jgi:hypothetical protein